MKGVDFKAYYLLLCDHPGTVLLSHFPKLILDPLSKTPCILGGSQNFDVAKWGGGSQNAVSAQ